MKIGRLLCLVGHHVRSRGQARHVAAGWYSRCRRCAKPMVRIGDEAWRLAEEGEVERLAAASASYRPPAAGSGSMATVGKADAASGSSRRWRLRMAAFRGGNPKRASDPDDPGNPSTA